MMVPDPLVAGSREPRWTVALEKLVLLQGFHELSDIRLHDADGNAKLAPDFTDNLHFGLPLLKPRQNQKSDGIQVENLAVRNVEYNRSIVVLRAAESV
jgi:hypothetical protein